MMTQRPTTGSLRSSGIRLAVLSLDRPLEERGERIRRRLALEEHGADLVADRQRDRVATRERQRRDDRPRALRDHARLALDRRGRPALRERHAELPVARKASGTREHEIAEPGEPGHGAGERAQRDRQPRHFGEPARDERGARILAQAETVGDAGGDGHDVLESPAHLDADHVAVGVEPELARAEPALERRGQGVVAGGDHRRRRTRQRHLAREGRPREHGHARVGESLRDHLAHAQVALGIEPFRRREDRHVGRDGRQGLQRGRHELGRHDDDRERGAAQGLVDVVRRLHRGRHIDVGQIPRAPAAGADAVDDLALARPEPDRGAAARDVDRQRRAPAAAADDRDAHAERRWPSFGSWPARSRVMFAWWRATTIAPTAKAAITKGGGAPRSRAPSGTQAAARMEPSDTYRKLMVTASHTSAAGSTASGTIFSSAPRPVATPLPPRKPRNTDQQLPMTAATAEAASTPASDAPAARAAPVTTAR